MRKKLLTLIVGGALAVASSAWSLTISDVGGYDKYLKGFYKVDNSSTDTELTDVEAFLREYHNNPTLKLTLTEKFEEGELSWNPLDDDPNGIAMPITNRPDYFLVKIGAKPDQLEKLLFENVSNPERSLDWAAIQLSVADGYTIKEIDAISHLTQFEGAPVPEPGTIVLLGAGFAALAVYGKRRRNT